MHASADHYVDGIPLQQNKELGLHGLDSTFGEEEYLRQPEAALSYQHLHARATQEKDEHPREGRDVEASAAPQDNLLGTPATRIVTAQDWTGPDDPENPYNWSKMKRAYHSVSPGLYGFTV